MLSSVLSIASVHAVDINLYDFAFNVDGTVAFPPPPPAGLPGTTVDDSGFDYLTGLGFINVSVTGAGPHFVGLFLDHDIDVAKNTFFNEYGTPVNSPALTQTWEIDEPGYLFGDIYDNFLASDASGSQLDNFNAVPSGTPDDVSMAIGWDISFLSGQSATLGFYVTETPPASGAFYLEHTDPDSNTSIYFSSAASIVGGPNVPESGSTFLLALCAFAGLVAARSFQMGPLPENGEN